MLFLKHHSFLHHFYPAYDTTIADYAAKITKQARQPPSAKNKAEAVKKTTLKEVSKPTNRKVTAILAEVSGRSEQS